MRNDFIFSIGGYILPVTPGEVSISNGVNIDKIELAIGGKIPKFVGSELRTISFTAEFPRPVYARTGMFEFAPVYRPYVRSEALSPVEYWNTFFKLMNAGDPVNVSISAFNEFLISGWYLIESMERSYSAENGSELQVDFTLVEYVERQTTIISEVSTSSQKDAVSEVFKTLHSMNESAKRYLQKAAENALDTVLNADFENSEERPRYNACNVPEFYTVSGDYESFNSIAFKFYKDILKASYIRDMNPFSEHYSLTQYLPKNMRVRISINRGDFE